MTLDLYAGIYVHAAKSWYAQLFGSEPSFIASETEAVWELAGHRSIFIEENAEHAGHAVHSIFLDDVDALAAPDRRARDRTSQGAWSGLWAKAWTTVTGRSSS